MIEVRAEIAASVWQIRVTPGQQVATGDELVVLESMKMEIPVTAPRPGTVAEVRVAESDKVAMGDVLVLLED